MYRYILVITIGLAAVSCSNDPAKTSTEATDTTTATKEVATKEVTTKEVGFKPPGDCSMSPPILDRSKITSMLTKNETISSNMSEQEIGQIVTDYINKKNKAFKGCKK